MKINFLDLVGFNWVVRPKVDTNGLWYLDNFDMLHLNGSNGLHEIPDAWIHLTTCNLHDYLVVICGRRYWRLDNLTFLSPPPF